MQPFTHSAFASRIVFARGATAQIGDEVDRLGISAALVLATPRQSQEAEGILEQIGSRGVGTYLGATRHTPIEVTRDAVRVLQRLSADGVISLGGGSTIGLGKAIAARTGVPQIVIPTTYAGSEVTAILGETENGLKSTRSGPEILPETVIYDPARTDALPVALSVTSGLNAMAHAAEAIYARDGSPLYTAIAVEALAALHKALPEIVKEPQNRAARDTALYGAWLCGTVLAGVGMSIHHKICHTLGGALDLPHAATHAVMLPHTIDYVEEVVPNALAPAAGVLGHRAGQALYDFAGELGAPRSLRELGVLEGDLDRMVELTIAIPYWAPRTIEAAGIRELLQCAWSGSRPGRSFS